MGEDECQTLCARYEALTEKKLDEAIENFRACLERVN